MCQSSVLASLNNSLMCWFFYLLSSWDNLKACWIMWKVHCAKDEEETFFLVYGKLTKLVMPDHRPQHSSLCLARGLCCILIPISIVPFFLSSQKMPPELIVKKSSVIIQWQSVIFLYAFIELNSYWVTFRHQWSVCLILLILVKM